MIEFRMPSLGATMEAGTLVEWRVKPGDEVAAGDIVAVVETEKAALEVEIFDAGRIEALLVQPGEKVPVGTVLATIRSDAGDKVASEAATQTATATALDKAPPSLPPPPLAGARQRISPAARKRCKALGINPEALGRGTGIDGAVTLRDVEDASASVAPPATRRDQVMRAMGAAMAQSKRHIPHYYLSSTIQVTRARTWLEEENKRLPTKERILFSALLYKAVALSLRQVPELNGYYRDDAFHPTESIHLGIAISLRKGGTVAPALHNVDKRSLADLMAGLSDLTLRTRAGSLRSSELTDSTTTVTSLGDRGPDMVVGVIHPPQVALIGFGAVHLRPWVDAGAVVVRPVVTASLSADHRASEGRQGARFLEYLASYLSRPEDL